MPHRTVTDIDTLFVKQVLDVAQRQQKRDIKHKGQPDTVLAGFEMLEWIAFCHRAG